VALAIDAEEHDTK